MSEGTNPFEEWRHVGDPEADQVIEDLHRSGELEAVNQVLKLLVENNELPAERLPESVRDYLEKSGQLPTWADAAKIEQGESIFELYGLTGVLVLALASLPECYVTPTIAEGLSATQKLIKQAHRRILETAQFVLAVMEKGGLDSNGDGGGIRAAQKVRLMHASIRFLILHTPTDEESKMDQHPLNRALLAMRWNETELGKPISQTDLIRTLFTFSYVIVRGWRTLGIELTSEQEEAYIHSWNVIGHIMGIDAEELPQTYADSEKQFTELKRQWHGDTEAGRLLTSALLDFVRQQLPWALRGLPPEILRDLVGEKTADELGVRKSNLLYACLNAVAVRVLRFINRARRSLYEVMPSIKLDREWISRRLLIRISALKPEWRDDLFQIPDSLAKRWDLAPEEPKHEAPPGSANKN